MTADVPSLAATSGQCALRKSLAHELSTVQTSAPPSESGVIAKRAKNDAVARLIVTVVPAEVAV